MKKFKSTLLIFLIVIGLTNCNEELGTSDFVPANDFEISFSNKKGMKIKKATGSVEIVWKGGQKGSDMGNKPENLRAFFDFNAHEGNDEIAPKGEIVYTVTDDFLTPHRTITATIEDVRIILDDVKGKMGWFIASVNYDSKGCSGGSGQGGHEPGCSGEDHTDGGCGDDTEHDGGCSHDTGDTGGTDHTDEGGCTDGHTDGESCSGSDSNEEEGHPGTPGSDDKGNPLSGKNCRVGQKIVVKVRDLATSGIYGDHITWKWFAPESAPSITDVEPQHLCKKDIIGGNITIHL
jgi:hypothetical protein